MGRQYVVGVDIVEIPQEAIDRFMKWNSLSFAKNQIFDRKLVQYLLVRCTKMKYLKKNRINGDIVDFITGEQSARSYKPLQKITNCVRAIFRNIIHPRQWRSATCRFVWAIQGRARQENGRCIGA